MFLAFLSEVLKDDYFAVIAKAGLIGMDKIYDLDSINHPVSSFSGIGSLVYLYYNLSVLWDDDNLYQKYEATIDKLEKSIELAEYETDIIGGLSGIIIMLDNIHKQSKENRLVEMIVRYGEKLSCLIANEEKLTGFSHGMSGFALAAMIAWNYTGDNKYCRLYRSLISDENAHYNCVSGNWEDLRDNSTKDSVYWCHGAAGIALSRHLMSYLCHEDDRESIARDKSLAIKKLLSDGFNEEMNHSLCHGMFGNLDILLTLAGGDDNSSTLPDKVDLISSQVIHDGHQRGVRYGGVGEVKELTGYMLGMTGIGMTLLRLIDARIPSILSLNVWRK